MPENRQIRLLAREGIQISNTTLNSYIHNGIDRLREFIGDVFKEFVQKAKYLMVDETTSPISTDGYTVYRMYDGEKSRVLHIGCWTHCRRLWVDVLPSDRSAMDIIELIGEMFRNEDLFRTMELSHEEIKNKRKKLTGPIMERIHHKVVMLLGDTKAMANGLMKKAATYTLNQWSSLRNILKDGSAEISNNLCEQRLKPVKPLLKNCMNIGSEVAAKNSVFIFSLIESYKLNNIDPQDYLKHLFECILNGKGCDKKALLPCFYKPEC